MGNVAALLVHGPNDNVVPFARGDTRSRNGALRLRIGALSFLRGVVRDAPRLNARRGAD